MSYPDTKSQIDLAAYASLDFNFTPYMSLGLEVQRGNLRGGEPSYGFINNYTTIVANGKLQLGEFLDSRAMNNGFLYAARGFYLASGVGVIKNNGQMYQPAIEDFRNTDIVFPFSAGINFFFKNHWGYSRFVLNLNLQSSLFLEDKMDGDLNEYSNFNDIYNYFSVGLKYNFGHFGLYRKR